MHDRDSPKGVVSLAVACHSVLQAQTNNIHPPVCSDNVQIWRRTIFYNDRHTLCRVTLVPIPNSPARSGLGRRSGRQKQVYFKPKYFGGKWMFYFIFCFYMCLVFWLRFPSHLNIIDSLHLSGFVCCLPLLLCFCCFRGFLDVQAADAGPHVTPLCFYVISTSKLQQNLVVLRFLLPSSPLRLFRLIRVYRSILLLFLLLSVCLLYWFRVSVGHCVISSQLGAEWNSYLCSRLIFGVVSCRLQFCSVKWRTTRCNCVCMF